MHSFIVFAKDIYILPFQAAELKQILVLTGLVGFAKDFKTCATLDDADTNQLFDVLRAGHSVSV